MKTRIRRRQKIRFRRVYKDSLSDPLKDKASIRMAWL
jgi:hypothetical protein